MTRADVLQGSSRSPSCGARTRPAQLQGVSAESAGSVMTSIRAAATRADAGQALCVKNPDELRLFPSRGSYPVRLAYFMAVA